MQREKSVKREEQKGKGRRERKKRAYEVSQGRQKDRKDFLDSQVKLSPLPEGKGNAKT